MRGSQIIRKTSETDIVLSLDLDGSGREDIQTGVGFLDHMRQLFSHHGRFDLSVICRGDLHVDAHHTTEDIGIALGQAFASALGEKKGIVRYGSMILPMDEALILCSVDLSGRSCLGWKMDIPGQKVGDFDTELVKEFWLAFVRESRSTLHFQQLAGENTHHIIEGMFKAAGRAFRSAVSIDGSFSDEIPSTKGTL